ncbi:amidohydrolase family protein [Jiangella mangrovi]|uniref:Aminocarboxymuconate-semialdehyde decarboxylase n=1 Tax=Jiangella mangrovi TaxID=1524084 RepID=A0A7W9LNG5_9ACTN|nr:amidohydrolase family protein [Jiangella mangrovi]MBB5790122.1 aminocarboxymuconate-semialdehyde decarboxylase [Jiangella mangrovi]
MAERPTGIDVHAHLFPQSAVSAAEHGQDWFGVPMSLNEQGRPVASLNGKSVAFGSPVHLEPPERRVERMTAMGVARQLVSVLPPLYQYGRDGAQRSAALRSVNDEITAMTAAFPDRFGGLAALPLPDVDLALAELKRTHDLGFAGIAVGTHVNGVNWDAEALFPVLEAAEALRSLVLIHPVFPRCGDAVRGHYLHNLIGNPYETAVAVASLVLGGVLDRLPDLRIVLAHGGGYTAFGIGRIDHGRRVRAEITQPAGVPSDYLKALYFDTLTHSEPALRYLVDEVGASQVVLGTDYPSDMGDDDPVRRLESYAWLSGEDRALIVSGNAQRLLGDG